MHLGGATKWDCFQINFSIFVCQCGGRVCCPLIRVGGEIPSSSPVQMSKCPWAKHFLCVCVRLRVLWIIALYKCGPFDYIFGRNQRYPSWETPVARPPTQQGSQSKQASSPWRIFFLLKDTLAEEEERNSGWRTPSLMMQLSRLHAYIIKINGSKDTKTRTDTVILRNQCIFIFFVDF